MAYGKSWHFFTAKIGRFTEVYHISILMRWDVSSFHHRIEHGNMAGKALMKGDEFPARRNLIDIPISAFSAVHMCLQVSLAKGMLGSGVAALVLAVFLLDVSERASVAALRLYHSPRGLQLSPIAHRGC